ncbi:chaperone protein dnaJ A6, chloroplastic-like isoform X1 [Iris pallida]|uniref:Chaperone protein dnaJ A6, chloroplastic-like isoform X1 n=1 Tax=Iris pallida TaxID=29817 RepID=A0AAX6F003_IRIPA|nr:chaperone protein dnaJ A6, chloroplastic-like isoform X1 [Iris pallida]
MSSATASCSSFFTSSNRIKALQISAMAPKNKVPFSPNSTKHAIFPSFSSSSSPPRTSALTSLGSWRQGGSSAASRVRASSPRRRGST